MTHKPVKAVEAEPLLLFGFRTQLPYPVPEFWRQHRFPKGIFLSRLSCRRLITHPNQPRFFLSPHRSCQGPLAPPRLDRSLIATTGLSDSPVSNTCLMDSICASFCSSRNRSQGSPSLPKQTFPARCPQPPRRVPPLLLNIASRLVLASAILGAWPLSGFINEAESGSLALRLTGSLHGASTPGLLPTPPASLHARCSVSMMNTFHFIGLVGGAGAPES